MIAQINIDTRTTLVLVALIISLCAPTMSFAMEDQLDNPPASMKENKLKTYTFKCQNKEKLTENKIKKIFKTIYKKNKQTKEIDSVEIADCLVNYNIAKYLARKANEYDIIKLVIPNNDQFILHYILLDNWMPKRKWKVEQITSKGVTHPSYKNLGWDCGMSCEGYYSSDPISCDRFNDYLRYSYTGLLLLGNTGGF